MAICPLIGTCQAKVDAEHYLKFCTNINVDAYKDCPHYKKQTEGVKTPSEWGRSFMPWLPTTPR